MQDQTYNLSVVKYFSLATIVWGVVGMGVGLLLAGQLAFPSLNFGSPMAQLRSAATIAYERRDFRFWWLCFDGQRLLCGTENRTGRHCLHQASRGLSSGGGKL